MLTMEAISGFESPKCAFDMSQLLDDLRSSGKSVKKRRTFSGIGWDLAEKMSFLNIENPERPRRSRTQHPPHEMLEEIPDMEENITTFMDDEVIDAGKEIDLEADDEADIPEGEADLHHALPAEVRKMFRDAVVARKPRFPLFKQPKEQFALVPYVPPEVVLQRILTGTLRKGNDVESGYESETDGEATRTLRKKIQEILADCTGTKPDLLATEAQMEVDDRA